MHGFLFIDKRLLHVISCDTGNYAIIPLKRLASFSLCNMFHYTDCSIPLLHISEVFCDSTDRSVSDLVGNTHRCFSHAHMFNSFKPGVPFMGRRQKKIAPDVTPQNAASHLRLFCLLTEFSSNN